MTRTPDWQTNDGSVRLFFGDAMPIVRELSGIDACVSDPPYGMKWNTDSTRFSGGCGASVAKRGIGRSDWGAIKNDDQPFDPSPFLNFPRVVLFGCNHFAQRLPVGTTLVWIKKLDSAFGTFLSDAEVAWMKGGHGVYCYRNTCEYFSIQRKRLHPNQKPVGLMSWCIDRAKVPPGGCVLDPFMGSASTAIACLRTNRRFVGVECERRYFDAAVRRIKDEIDPEPPDKTMPLFQKQIYEDNQVNSASRLT